jgi:hypothetical protein
MQIRGVSSRRSLFSLCVVICAGLVLMLSAAGAAGRPSCKKGAEAAGCKLPDGTRFFKDLGSADLTVQVSPTGISFNTYGAPIKCTKYIPLQGNTAYVAVGMHSPKQPQVGKTYVLKETETRRGEEGEGTSTTTTEVTLVFKSAKQLRLTIHQVGSTDGEPGCDGTGSWTVQRQS